jgi:hypothetical protein
LTLNASRNERQIPSPTPSFYFLAGLEVKTANEDDRGYLLQAY